MGRKWAGPRRITCATCGGMIEQAVTGRPRRFCGQACRQAAARWQLRVQPRQPTLHDALGTEPA